MRELQRLQIQNVKVIRESAEKSKPRVEAIRQCLLKASHRNSKENNVMSKLLQAKLPCYWASLFHGTPLLKQNYPISCNHDIYM